ncbi:MAG: methyltransferase [Candidatus Woesearchaeota archaeon]|nr:methyltransferase [Candidatus Woesearchaeota archaeon]
MADLASIIASNVNGSLPTPGRIQPGAYIETWKDLFGLSFPAGAETEPVARSEAQQAELQAYLDSPEHVRDREKLLEHIRGSRVLELGSGSGSMLELISAGHHNLSMLVGVEFSPYFFQHAAAKLFADKARNGDAQIFLVRGDVTQTSITPSFFDTAVMTSIVHEIKSLYGVAAVENIFENVYGGLAPGGSLVVYDGFRRPDEDARLQLHTAYSSERFDEYVAARNGELALSYEADEVILPVSDAVEFATKLQASEGWDVELREDYYPFSLAQYRGILEDIGFRIEVKTFSEEIDQSALAEHITVHNYATGANELTAHHNALIVARK